MIFNDFKYVPILSIKPAEMAALEELPEKDKDLLLPVIPLKRWANSRLLENSINRVRKAFGSRKIILDIDKSYLADVRQRVDKNLPVFEAFEELSNPEGGYKYWVEFIEKDQNLIPAIQFGDLGDLHTQLESLASLGRPIVARFEMTGAHAISPDEFTEAVNKLVEFSNLPPLMIILDYGDVDRVALLDYSAYSDLLNKLHELFYSAAFSLSGTSFPYEFSGSYRGEVPIYERQIFNKVQGECPDLNLIYSDRASTRAKDIAGGGGTPPPRIDYPLKNDWRFVRKEFDDREKEELYQEAAREVMESDYWNVDLHLWGTQMIEKTSMGDSYGITSPNRATAVRINMHLYQQLHYFSELSELDTDEDWED